MKRISITSITYNSLTNILKNALIPIYFLIFVCGLLYSTDLPSSEDALKLLQDGNSRFSSGKTIHPRIDKNRMIETTTGGQHPFATVITCSDSRVAPEILFDQGIGDLFVIRVAGNVCDTDEIGSIEYGVDHLETPVLVVLGHEHCGAVTAVVTDAELHGSIPPLVDNIKPAVEKTKSQHSHLDDEALVPAAVRANVWQSIEDLFHGSAAARDRVKSGTLRVEGAVYDIATGNIEWMGTHPEQSTLLINVVNKLNSH